MTSQGTRVRMPVPTGRVTRRMGIRALLLILALAVLPSAAHAANSTCNADIAIDYVSGPSCPIPGDMVRVRLTFGAGSITNGTTFTLNRARFDLACANPPPPGSVPCTPDGMVIGYQGDSTITTTCTGVSFSTGHAVGGSPNEVVFTPSAPIAIPASTPAFCQLEFDVQVLGPSSTPTVDEVAGYNSTTGDGQCDNGLSSSGAQSGSLTVCTTTTTTTSTSTTSSTTSTSTTSSTTSTSTTSSTTSTSTTSTTTTTATTGSTTSTTCPTVQVGSQLVGASFLVNTNGRFGNDSTIQGGFGANFIGGLVQTGKGADSDSLIGDLVSILNNAHAGTVISNTTHTGRGATITNNLQGTRGSAPLLTPFCPIPTIDCSGGTNVSVSATGIRHLVPGTYGQLIARNGARIFLDGPGAFTFCSIHAARNSKILVTGGGQSTIDVAQDFRLEDGGNLAPASGTTTPVLNVAGTLVRVGAAAVLQAFIAAPNAHLTVGRGGEILGTFCVLTASSDKGVTLLCPPAATATTTPTTTSSTIPRGGDKHERRPRRPRP